MRHALVGLVFSGAILSVSTVFALEAPRDEPVRVLLLSGQNNHDWRKTTPKVKSILERTQQFHVTVDERPHQLTLQRLKLFQVVLSNWNSFTYDNSKSSSPDWPAAVKQAYLQFVRQGGGHVVVHAGSASFASWEDYQELTLATWKKGQTGHGQRHEFKVRIDATDHPIAKGLSNYTYFGELWHRPAVQKGSTVIASAMSAREYGGSGEQEPVALAGQFGKGRSFTFLLGHSVDEMEREGFRTMLIQGTEWAATGKVTETKHRDSPSNPAEKQESP